MELKRDRLREQSEDDPRLNRTFYGIETPSKIGGNRRPASLNRTFYGIETLLILHAQVGEGVLIVPFMELKHQASGHIS